MRCGIDVLRASVAPGPPPVKSEAALRVALPLLEQPVSTREIAGHLLDLYGVEVSADLISTENRVKKVCATAQTIAV